MENNRLELLPESLGELPGVIKMDLSTNNLRYLPASMGQLKKVQRIDVGNNLLTKVCVRRRAWGGCQVGTCALGDCRLVGLNEG